MLVVEIKLEAWMEPEQHVRGGDVEEVQECGRKGEKQRKQRKREGINID